MAIPAGEVCCLHVMAAHILRNRTVTVVRKLFWLLSRHCCQECQWKLHFR